MKPSKWPKTPAFDVRRPWPRTLLAFALVVQFVAGWLVGQNVRAAMQEEGLPVVSIDALDPARWSMSKLEVAPGQTIAITNRGVQNHTFAVREWGVDVELPTFETITVVVPADLEPGTTFAFYCSEPGHRSLGQEGTITIITPEQAMANGLESNNGPSDKIVLETSDSFTWSVPAFDASPGQFIEIRNPGVIEHHFVVDEWGINETISPGEVVLVQVPESAEVGQTVIFYCSVPGHRTAGEEGAITIVQPKSENPDDSGPVGPRDEPNLDQFIPDASVLGDGWSLVRTGDARAVVTDFDTVNSQVFPGTGRGATFVGPGGSRATVLVLPFQPVGVPGNQVDDAILTFQLLLMAEWETNLEASKQLNELRPPTGCDASNRVAGVTRVYTLPAGSTVCQLRTAGIAIFVTIEGEFSASSEVTISGVEASDQIVLRLLEGA